VNPLGEVAAPQRSLRHAVRRLRRPASPDDGVVTAFHDGVVTLRANRRTDGFHESLNNEGYVGVRRGDLVIHGLDLVHGAVGVSDSDGQITPVCWVVEPEADMDPRFLAYTLRAIGKAGYVRANAKGVRSAGADYRRWETLAEVPVPAPDAGYQRVAADFLDRETTRIRSVNSELAGLLGVGTALAISRFSEAVANLPEGRVGYRFEVQLGKMLDEKRNRLGSHRPYLRNTNVQWDRVDLADLKEMTFEPHELDRYSVRRGDLLVCEGGDPGRCAIWGGPDGMCIQKALLRVRPFGDASARYLFWVLRLCHARGDFRADGTGATILHLPAERLRSLRVPMPDPVSQRRLAELADEVAGDSSVLDEEVEALRAGLAEYRDALIAEAVTGRLDVSRLGERQMEESLAAVREGERPEVLT
jgi:type I restriction enzyme, S subunit